MSYGRGLTLHFEHVMGYAVGQQFRSERTFTRADVAAFAEVSRDFGDHHVTPDEAGRVMVHGLHTASLATLIGGQINYLSRDMKFEFIDPVWSGDTIRCVATVDEAEQRGARWRYNISFEFFNQRDAIVATGSSRGVVLQPASS